MFIRSPYKSTEVLPWEKETEFVFFDEPLPTLSIVIPIYNSGRYIEKTLRSLLCNNLAGVEILLMDGGSTDDTMDIVQHYADMFTVIHSAPDKGQSDAINKGFAKANGDILYWINGDDILLPGALDAVRKHFKGHADCHILVGSAYMTDLEMRISSRHAFPAQKLTFAYLSDYVHHHLIQPSVFFSANAWNTVGPLDTEDHFAMDADLFLGMAKRYTFDSIEKDLAYSRYHPECKTRKYHKESLYALALVQAKHGAQDFARATLNMVQDLNEKQSEKTVSFDTEQLEYALSAANHSRTVQAQLLTSALQKAQQQLTHMHSTLSWKITAPLRHLGRFGRVPSIRKIVYAFFKACKDLWVDFGKPFPRVAHFVRYTIFGQWKPYSHTAASTVGVVYGQGAEMLPTVQSVITQSLPFDRIIVLYDQHHKDVAFCTQKYPFIDFRDIRNSPSLRDVLHRIASETDNAYVCLIPNSSVLRADALRSCRVFFDTHDHTSAVTLPTSTQDAIRPVHMPTTDVPNSFVSDPVCIRAQSL